MNANKDSVLRRIRALIVLSNKAGTPEEAASAAAKAQELMDRYNIMSIDTQVDEEVISSGDKGIWLDADRQYARLDLWRSILSSSVAELNGCYTYTIEEPSKSPNRSKSLRLGLIGKHTDVITASYLYDYLSDRIEAISAESCKGKGRTYANNFRIGMAEAVIARLRESREQTKNAIRAEAHPNAQAHVEKALVQLDARRDAVLRWINDSAAFERIESKTKTYKSDAKAYAAGHKAGNDLPLSDHKPLTDG